MPIISTFPTGESTVDYVGPKSGLPALEEGKVGYATDEKHLYTGNADGQNTQIPNADDLKMHTDNGDIHVTAEKKAVWDKSVVIGEKEINVQLPNIDSSWECISYCKDKFLISGDQYIAYSSDGLQWNKIYSPSFGSCRSFCYAHDYYQGFDLSGQLISSGDGFRWGCTSVKLDITFGDHLQISYGNGMSVALGNNDIFYSDSLSGWIAGSLPDAGKGGTLCFGKDKFVIISKSDKAFYSVDGKTWIQTAMPANKPWVSVCYGNDKFVALSQSGDAAYSTDGINWILTSTLIEKNFISVCYGDGKFVAVSWQGDVAIYSTDGIHWEQTLLPMLMGWQSVCYGDGKFVATADQTNAYAYSTDGINWTTKAVVPTVQNTAGESSVNSIKAALRYSPEEIGAAVEGEAMQIYTLVQRDMEDLADKTEVSDAVDSHNLAEDAHAAKFAEKQDKIKGKAGKYIGFTADDTVGEVSAPISGGSRLTIHFDNAFVGQVWTLSGGGETYTGTVDSTLTVTVGVLGVNTTYTVECTLSGISYTTEITTADYYTALSVELIKFQSTITVTIDSGSTVTASLGDTVFTEISDGTAVLTVNKAGSWAIKATKDSKTASGMVTINANGQSKTLTLIYVPIYGASWDGTSTTKWSRTDDAETFVDPVPYTEGAEKYGSPFDELLPWAGMVKSERVGGTMVAIPKFWYKLTQNGKSLKIQIASKPTAGFSVSPAHVDRGDGKGERDVVYVGRYHCNYNYKSVTGDSPQTLINRSTARSSIHAIGENIWQADFVLRFTLWLLYIVEFANWDSQGCIGFGCGNGGDAHKTGGTDTMPYHTGVPATYLSYSGSAQYRYIEGLWDSCYDWCDGCYNSSDGFNIILNPNNFNDSKNGVSVGIPMSGYPSAFIVNAVPGLPALFIPTEKNGSKSSYTCDSWGFGSSSPCVYVGGCYSQLEVYGLFYISYGTSSYSEDSIGCRLQELP